MGEAYGALTEAPAEEAEAAENVNRMPKRGGVSSCSPMEEIGLWRVPRQEEEGTMAIVKGSWARVSVGFRPWMLRRGFFARLLVHQGSGSMRCRWPVRARGRSVRGCAADVGAWPWEEMDAGVLPWGWGGKVG